MKVRAIGFALFLISSIPVAALATDFQIDKIVNDALTRAQASQATQEGTHDSKLPGGSTASVALSNPPAAELASIGSSTEDVPPTRSPARKAEKTDPVSDPVKEN